MYRPLNMPKLQTLNKNRGNSYEVYNDQLPEALPL